MKVREIINVQLRERERVRQKVSWKDKQREQNEGRETESDCLPDQEIDKHTYGLFLVALFKDCSVKTELSYW